MAKPNAPQGNTVTVTAQNQFTEEIFIGNGKKLIVDLSGSGTMTLTVQRRLPGGTTWVDQDTLGTTNGLYQLNGVGKYWRAGCKTGDFSSGTRTLNVSGSPTD